MSLSRYNLLEVTKIKESWFVVEKSESSHYLFAASPIHSLTTEFEQIGFPNMKQGGAEYIKDGAKYVFEKKEWVANAKNCLKILLDDPEQLKKVNQEVVDLSKQLVDCSEDLLKKDLKTCSNQELAQLYNQFEDVRNQSHIRRGPMWLIETSGELYTNHILKKLDDRIKKKQLDLIADNVFAVLSTPVEKNQSAKEKEDFLRIALELISEKELTETVIKDKLKQHAENYRWLPYGVGGPALSDLHFLEAMQELLKKGRCYLEQELYKITTEPGELRRKKEELIAAIEPGAGLLQLCNLAEDTIYVKSFSKEAMFYSYYCVEPLFQEISSRLGINIRLLRIMLPWEIGPALNGKRVNKKELEERWKHSFHYIENGKSKIFCGDQAKRFVKSLRYEPEEAVDSDIRELKGNCARNGYAKGIVKIINSPKDLPKMEDGNILVSYMTEPEIVVAMQKASAIVTDMGGITCHAAIVSRELGKPCVIGTRMATKIFRDGDVVEVDADNGVVRLIEERGDCS